MKELFTQGRKGAKQGSKSENLSVFASLRETSGLKRVEESFTQTHKGAKRRNKSKDRRFFRHAIGDALDAMLDQVVAEIDGEAESFVHQSQIGQHLFAVDWIERGDRFHFHDHAIIDDQVGTKAFIEPDPIPCDRKRYLSFHRLAAFSRFVRKRNFVNDFQDAWPQPGMQAVGSVDDYSRDFILSHAPKPVLLLPACEAKNLSAFGSLRETSSPETISGQGAKTQKGGTNQETPGLLGSTARDAVSFSNLGALASLPEISGSKYKRT